MKSSASPMGCSITRAATSSSFPPRPEPLTSSLLPPVNECLPEHSGRSLPAFAPHSKLATTHPYARIYAKKAAEKQKRRKVWTHALEKELFSPNELSTIGAPNRRTVYQASLEAHIDALHEELLKHELFPVPLEHLEPFRGLNCKTAKSMVAGLQHDATLTKMKLRELERANHGLRNILKSRHAPTESSS